MRMKYKFIEIRAIALIAFLIFFSFSLPGNEEPKNKGPVIERRRIVNDHSSVTKDKNYFTFSSRFIGITAQDVNRAIRHLPRITDNIRAFLKNDNNLKLGNEILIPAWGGLYCNMPELTGRRDVVNINEPAYVLSLLFCSKFEEAEITAKAILEKENENYGALLMLGLLSEHKEDNFPYLSRAFLINPYKTLLVFDWHLDKFYIPPSEDWDFVNAFFQMLTKNKNLLQNLELPPKVAIRLNQAFRAKYEDKEVDSDMEVMISIIRKNMQIEKMREIHRKNVETSSESFIYRSN